METTHARLLPKNLSSRKAGTAGCLSPRMVLMAEKIGLLRCMRRFAAHQNVCLKTFRSLADLDSLKILEQFDVLLFMGSCEQHDELYTIQCLDLLCHNLPVVLILSEGAQLESGKLPSTVKAIIDERQGWTKILRVATEICASSKIPGAEEAVADSQKGVT